MKGDFVPSALRSGSRVMLKACLRHEARRQGAPLARDDRGCGWLVAGCWIAAGQREIWYEGAYILSRAHSAEIRKRI